MHCRQASKVHLTHSWSMAAQLKQLPAFSEYLSMQELQVPAFSQARQAPSKEVHLRQRCWSVGQQPGEQASHMKAPSCLWHCEQLSSKVVQGLHRSFSRMAVVRHLKQTPGEHCSQSANTQWQLLQRWEVVLSRKVSGVHAAQAWLEVQQVHPLMTWAQAWQLPATGQNWSSQLVQLSVELRQALQWLSAVLQDSHLPALRKYSSEVHCRHCPCMLQLSQWARLMHLKHFFSCRSKQQFSRQRSQLSLVVHSRQLSGHGWQSFGNTGTVLMQKPLSHCSQAEPEEQWRQLMLQILQEGASLQQPGSQVSQAEALWQAWQWEGQLRQRWLVWLRKYLSRQAVHADLLVHAPQPVIAELQSGQDVVLAAQDPALHAPHSILPLLQLQVAQLEITCSHFRHWLPTCQQFSTQRQALPAGSGWQLLAASQRRQTAGSKHTLQPVTAQLAVGREWAWTARASGRRRARASRKCWPFMCFC